MFRKAVSTDAASIAALINSAYRGESSRHGWTTEADLLSGLRTEVEEVLSLIAADNSMLLLCFDAATLLGSVTLEKQGDAAHLGMFAVHPQQQGQGIGKQLLAFAEHAAAETWGVNSIVMSVITLRQELIAFYQRRGYSLTGVLKAFPAESKLWTPLVSSLQLGLMEKSLDPHHTSA
ncbi:MAG TPA: GNAT family N-acetyltransferase [Methylophilaceae bacterium]